MKKLTLLLCFSLVASPLFAAPPRTFSEAKKIAWKLHAPESVEFYCGCRYNGKDVDLESCGYIPRKNPQRASRIEWEHVVPAWVIGHQRQCWQKPGKDGKPGGRKNCAATDTVFQIAEADLHNLVPAIGEINGDRSNFSFSWLPGKPHQYGKCETLIDFKTQRVMPRQEVRGTVARIYLYMSEQYNLQLSHQDRQIYEVWNKTFLPSEAERQRNQRIACVMGRGNRFVGEVDMKQCKR